MCKAARLYFIFGCLGLYHLMDMQILGGSVANKVRRIYFILALVDKLCQHTNANK